MADATSEADVVVAQPVSAPLTRAAIFLVVTINPGDDNRDAVRSFCADFAGLVRAVEFRDLEASDIRQDRLSLLADGACGLARVRAA